MAPDDHDPELAAAAAGLPRNADGGERWHLWVNNGLAYAWLQPSTSPPVVLRDRTAEGLRGRVMEFERVLAETGSLGRALAAAERLET